MTLVGSYEKIHPGRSFVSPVVASSAYDSDAQAFINAVGTLTTAQQDAVNQLVLDMKSAGVWAKGHCYHPMVGGTASAHKWNLFNPVDSDAAYRAAFYGGWTHSANGAQGNGSNAFANTFIEPPLHLTNNSNALVYVSGTSASHNSAEIGAGTNNHSHRMVIYNRWGGIMYSGMYNTSYGTGGALQVGVSDGSGVFIASRTSSLVFKVFRNGSAIVSNTNTSSISSLTGITTHITYNALNRPNYKDYSPRQCRGAGVFDGLTDAEASALTTAIQTFNTALGR